MNENIDALMTFITALLATLIGCLSVVLNSKWKKNNFYLNEKLLKTIHKSEEKVELTNRSEEVDEYYKTIDDLIKSHHKQALFQAKIQFWCSLIVSIFGFLFIIFAVFYFKENKWYEILVKLVPGIILEAVSALFFTQSKSIRTQSSDFLNRLRTDRLYEKGIKITETIENPKLKDFIKAEIALNLCGIEKVDITSKYSFKSEKDTSSCND